MPFVGRLKFSSDSLIYALLLPECLSVMLALLVISTMTEARRQVCTLSDTWTSDTRHPASVSSGVPHPHRRGVHMRHLINVKSTISNDSMGAPSHTPPILVPFCHGLCVIDRPAAVMPLLFDCMCVGKHPMPSRPVCWLLWESAGFIQICKASAGFIQICKASGPSKPMGKRMSMKVPKQDSRLHTSCS